MLYREARIKDIHRQASRCTDIFCNYLEAGGHMDHYHEVGYLDQPLGILDGQKNVGVDCVPKSSKACNADTEVGCNDESVRQINALHHFLVWTGRLSQSCLYQTRPDGSN